MTETSYSLLLQNLSADYYHNHLSFEEYRQQRKVILDKIDEEMNGNKTQETDQQASDNNPLFMQTIGFFKNTSIDK